MPIKVFFDGRCGLCRREIQHYQRLDQMHVFDWIDATSEMAALQAANINQAQALRYLHVQDRFGNWHIGVDAFIIIWRHLPRWRYLGKIAALPLIRLGLQWLYKPFAQWRFEKLGYCALEDSPLEADTQQGNSTPPDPKKFKR